MSTGQGPVTDILIVEDSPTDLLFTRRAFRDVGYDGELHVVTDGEQALDFLYRRGSFLMAPRPNVILLDLNLPRISGHEVLTQIKADPELAEIPVVVLTTSNRPEDVSISYRRYANCYVTKPIDFHEFREAIRSIGHFWMDTARIPEPRQ